MGDPNGFSTDVRTELEAAHAGLLTPSESARLRETALLIAGCGVGSVVATAAARLGFERFRLVDGDVVEARNLNRQAYSAADIGRPKAEALAAILCAINPQCEVHVTPEYVSPANAGALVADADIVVDAIDPTSGAAVIALHRAARREHKPVISPLDVGWGGSLQVFMPLEPSLEELLGLDLGPDLTGADDGRIFSALIPLLQDMVPPYLAAAVQSVLDGSLEHFPQPVSGAMISSAMTVVAAMRLALGQPLNTGPSAAVFDPWLVHEDPAQ